MYWTFADNTNASGNAAGSFTQVVISNNGTTLTLATDYSLGGTISY